MKQKRNVLLITLISFFVPVFLFAGPLFQEEIAANGFVKKIDGIGNFIAASETSDGGYVSVSTNRGLTVNKLSLSGELLWKSSFTISGPFGWQAWLEIRGIAEVKDGYIVVGSFFDWDRGSAGLLIKLDINGSIVSSKYLCCGLDLKSVAAQPDGTFIATAIGPDSSAVVIKFSAAGKRIWAKQFQQLKTAYNTPGSLYVWNMVSSPTFDNGFVLATMRWEGDGTNGVYLLKVNADGVPIWNRILHMENFAPGLIRAASDGGVLLFDAYQNILVRLSPSGRFQWAAKYYLDTKDAELVLGDAIQTADGGYAIVGRTRFPLGEDREALLIKIDRHGKLIFQKRLGKKESGEAATTIFSTADNDYVIFGSRNTTDSQSQLILRVDSEGKLSGCNYISPIHSVEQKFLSGIRTSKFQLKKASYITFASHKTDTASVKIKQSIEAVCE